MPRLLRDDQLSFEALREQARRKGLGVHRYFCDRQTLESFLEDLISVEDCVALADAKYRAHVARSRETHRRLRAEALADV